MNDTWMEIACTVPTAMVDELSVFLVELSGNGVSVENLSVDTFSTDTIEDSPTKTVKTYFSEGAIDDRIAAITAFLELEGPRHGGYIPQEPTVTIIGAEDWANNWKQHFPPTRIGSKMVIKPTWEPYNSAGEIIIELDPGLAFGTGTHETTRMCLELLEELFFDQKYLNVAQKHPIHVLDVGTGSGILSIAAAKCGAERVVAIDIDPRAVAVTLENLTLNHVADRVLASTTPLTNVAGTYQIVVANILAEELVRLAGDLFDKVAAGGFLVLSGILNEREEHVRQGFAHHALALMEARREAEWSCLCYRRNS
jgi:ribosomal protein L11 methyltransferase